MSAGLTRGAVLVADDDAAIRSVVRQALETEGWGVLEAGDGAAALATYEREAAGVALVLMDLTMPVLSGAQFAELYWKLDGNMTSDGARHGHAPMVVFTAEQGMVAAEEAERLRAVGFLTKPFDLDALLDVVARCARPVREAAPPDASSGADEMDRHRATTRSDDGDREGTGRREAELMPAKPIAAQAGSKARMPVKVSREELARQQQMDRLRLELGRLQEDMGKVRSGVTQVTQIESSRKLTREEARWASQLRMESERLRQELLLIRSEFYRIKDERAARAD